MSLCGTDQDKDRLIKRLNRIEGQVRGLRNMIEKDDECMDVLHQISSVTGALKGIWLQIVGDHIRGCVGRSDFKGINRDEMINELIKHIEKVK